MRLSRRDFLKLAGVAGIASVIPHDMIQKALGGNGHARVIWLQGQGCTGCSVSLLNSVNIATIDDVLLNHINLEYHSNLIASAGDLALADAMGPQPALNEIAVLGDEWLSTGPALQMDVSGPQGASDGKVNLMDFAALCKQGYVLVVEGAIPTGSAGRFCHVGGDMTMLQAFDRFSAHADSILAVGTCAAFGGIAAASPNPTGALSVSGALSYLSRTKTVINIPGCPMHPDWFVGTVIKLLAGQSVALDGSKRPLDYFGSTVHSSCSNLSQYNSAYAPNVSTNHEGRNTTATSCLSCHSRTSTRVPNPRTLGMTGCLWALNCKGRITYGDCATRKWNNPAAGQNGVNWCIGAGSPCHGCTQPNFPDGITPFYTLG